MVTKKDYEIIAKAIRDTRYNSADPIYAQAMNDLTIHLGALLRNNYDNFKETAWISGTEYGKLPRVSEVA